MSNLEKGERVEEFRSIFESSLSDINSRTLGPNGDHSKRCIILSGGVDTCAIMAAARKIGMKFSGALTVVTSDESPDFGFSTACAAEHGLTHHVIRLTAEELVSQYLPPVVKQLKIFNGMLLRNSLVIAAVFKKAAALGFTDAVVGDGADELFGGYSFMWLPGDAEWKVKRDKMCEAWTFSTEELANMYGMTPHSPYTHPNTVDWAIRTTVRSDCIGTHPIRLFYGGDTIPHITGKVILRQAYDTVSSWRRKDPIEVGSGVTIIGHDPYWKDIISDEEFEKETSHLLTRSYRIRSKENLANFREFEKCFGRDGAQQSLIKRLAVGEGCVDCCFDIGEKNFCHMCGAYPAQRSHAATHYYDNKLHKLLLKDGAEKKEE